MINIAEAVVNVLQSFVDDEPKSPLHIGEAMNCWTYLGMLEEEKSIVQLMINTTTDDELMETLRDSEKLADSQMKKLKEFMQIEGVPLPPASEERPKSEPNAIPMGANGVSQSVRNDVGLMFTQFLGEKLVFGVNLKAKMRKRGWLKVPPYYYPPGLPKQ